MYTLGVIQYRIIMISAQRFYAFRHWCLRFLHAKSMLNGWLILQENLLQPWCVSIVKTGFCFMLAVKKLFVANVSQACRSAVPDDVLMFYAIDYVTIYWKTLWHFAKSCQALDSHR